MRVRRRYSFRVVCAALVCGSGASAQDPASAQSAERRPAAAESVVEQPTAPVVMDGVTLFRVRGISSYPAERRAAEIANRIAAVAADRAIPAESLTVQDTPTASIVVAKGQRLFGVLDADAELEGLTRQLVAGAYRDRVAEAITEFRRDREASTLWKDFSRAAVATLGFLLLVELDRRTLRRVRGAVTARYRSKVQDVRFSTVEIVRGDQIWNVLQHAVRILAVLVAFVAAYVYLNYVLVLFPWTRALGRSLTNILVQPLKTLATGFLAFIPDLVFLIILAVITRWILRLVRLYFARVAEGETEVRGFDADWAKPTERIVRFVIVAMALVIAYPYIPGSDSEAFKGIGVVVGLMFSLGSASIIGNLVAGLGIAFRRAFRVGDRVRIGDTVGEVTQVELLTTYLRSPKNEQIVIPNSLILNNEVVNYSALVRSGAGLIVHTNVGIGYETPWRQVEAMLIQAARRTPGIRAEPEPFVLQRSLGDFAVNYEINAYTNEPRRILATYSDLHRNILDVFNEYGVQIMTPAYEGDPEQPKLVPRDQWFMSPAALPTREPVVEPPMAAPPADALQATRRDGESSTVPAWPAEKA
jgi:small-conductance mechanosensitive channel